MIDPKEQVTDQLLDAMREKLDRSVYREPKVTRETFQEGLVDLDCQVTVYPTAPGKKACKVLNRRINPDRAANRALSFCGTRYML